jgi:hypothetical protein
MSYKESAATLASGLVKNEQYKPIVQQGIVASLSLIEEAVNKIFGTRSKLKITCLFVGGGYKTSS